MVLQENRVLLVRRANPPDAGKRGFPGGKMEWGETIGDAAVREILEETGVTATAANVFAAVDCFGAREDGGLRGYFVLLAVLCERVSGSPAGSDDAQEVRRFSMDELE